MIILRAAMEAEPDVWWERLRTMAMRLCKQHPMAEDIAQDVWLRVWGQDAEIEVHSTVIAYLGAMVRHEFLNASRGNVMGGGRTEAAFQKNRASESEALALATPPRQFEACQVAEALRAIDCLPEREREAVLHSAFHESVADAAKYLGRERSGFFRDAKNGRAALAERLGRPERASAGERFRGVHRHHRRWVATIGQGGRCIYLGTFETPEEAAVAYDVAAWSRFGARAVLNFPALLADAA